MRISRTGCRWLIEGYEEIASSSARTSWPKRAQGTLGIVGRGNIGRRVARLASVFEMKALAFYPLLDAATQRERGAEPVSFEELLAQSEFVTVHCPRGGIHASWRPITARASRPPRGDVWRNGRPSRSSA